MVIVLGAVGLNIALLVDRLLFSCTNWEAVAGSPHS